MIRDMLGDRSARHRIHPRANNEARINGWDIWQAPGGEWMVARIDEFGDYLDTALFSRKAQAIRFAETHVPADLLDRPAASVTRLEPRR